MQARVDAHRPWTSAGKGWPLSRTSSATEKDDRMAVPKRRTSKRKKRARRTHYKAAPIALQPCPRCGDLKRPHRVCPTCGYYRDEQRVEVEGAVLALRDLPPGFRIQLVGRTADIEAALKAHGAVDRSRLEVVE